MQRIVLTDSVKKYRINIGKSGEHDVETIVFDVSEYITAHGAMNATLVFESPKSETFPVAITQSTDKKTVTWVIKEDVTATPGFAIAQLVLTGENNLKISTAIMCEIYKGIPAVDSSKIPLSYIAQVNAKLEEVKNAGGLVVKLTMNEATITADKTPTEILNAASLGKTVVATFSNALFVLNSITASAITFGSVVKTSDGTYTYIATFEANGAITMSTKKLATADDIPSLTGYTKNADADDSATVLGSLKQSLTDLQTTISSSLYPLIDSGIYPESDAEEAVSTMSLDDVSVMSDTTIQWVLGGLSNDGSINTTKKARAYTVDILTATKDFAFTVPNGFSCNTVSYNSDGSVIGYTNATTAAINISSGQRFRVGIKRATEVSGEVWTDDDIRTYTAWFDEYMNDSGSSDSGGSDSGGSGTTPSEPSENPTPTVPTSGEKTTLRKMVESNASEIADLKARPTVAEREYSLFGTTPCFYPYGNTEKFKLKGNGTVSISGITVCDMEHIGTVSYKNIEKVASDEGYKYKITALGSNGNDYRVNGSVSGLIIGETYRLCFKVDRTALSETGHYVQVYVAPKTLKSFNNVYNDKYECYTETFVATKETASFYIYPFQTNGAEYTQAVGDEITVYDMYVNRVYDGKDYFTHEAYRNESVTVNGETVINADKNVIIGGYGIEVYASLKTSKVVTINEESPDFGGNIHIKKSHLDGKVCVCFGDSITQSYKPTTFNRTISYSDIIAENTGMTVYNLGVGGSTMRKRNLSNWDACSMVGFADAITDNDFSALQAIPSSSTDNYSRIRNILEWLPTFDWDKVDYITIALGANDASLDTWNKIDNADDPYDTTTYLGAFRYAYEKIATEYPHIRFLIMTPIYRWYKNDDGTFEDSDERIYHGDNIYYYTWGEKLMEVCDTYHLNYVDMYNIGINKVNRLHYFTDRLSSKGVHPNDNGARLMGDVVSGALLSKF